MDYGLSSTLRAFMEFRKVHKQPDWFANGLQIVSWFSVKWKRQRPS